MRITHRLLVTAFPISLLSACAGAATGQWKNCYNNGLVVTFTNGNVDGLVIVAPGC